MLTVILLITIIIYLAVESAIKTTLPERILDRPQYNYLSACDAGAQTTADAMLYTSCLI